MYNVYCNLYYIYYIMYYMYIHCNCCTCKQIISAHTYFNYILLYVYTIYNVLYMGPFIYLGSY